MGGLTSSLGFGGGGNSGKSGVNYTASGAPIQSPVTPEQAAQAYKNAQDALQQQQAFVAATQASNGLGNQSSVFNQLQGVTNGTGPNPAQAMLANATGANTANQAALIAGQRGAGSNAGLIARQAAMQGGANQQNLAGQAAALQANQSLNALGQQGGIAGQQVAQQSGALGNYNQFAQGEQSNLLNSIAGVNQANVGMQGNINNANSGLANTVAKGQQGLVSGVMGGIGSATGLFAQGGEVPRSFIGQHYHKGGHVVPAMVSPGEVYLPPKKAEEVAAKGKNPIAEGERIPGKAKVRGDSLKNDTVHKNLEAGGIVIPKSIMESDDAAKKAHAFVQAIVAKRGKKLP